MDAYRRFKQPDLFLSLKRDLAMVSGLTHLLNYILSHFFHFFFLLLTWNPSVIFMIVTQQVFVAGEWVKYKSDQVRAEAHSNAETEKILGAFKEEHAELTNNLTISERERLNAVAGLKSAKTQAHDQRKKLYTTELDLATQK